MKYYFTHTGEVLDSRLHEDISAALPLMTIESLLVKSMPDNLVNIYVEFELPLSSGDYDLLESTVQNHVWVYNDKLDYKIYDYVKSFSYSSKRIAPEELPYDILGLYKQVIYEEWEVTTVNYRGGYDSILKEYSNLVVEEMHSTVKDEYNYPTEYHISITWVRKDDSHSDPKLVKSILSNMEATEYGEKRRGHIINNAKINAVGAIAATESISIPDAEDKGRVFLNKYTIEAQQFRDWDQTPLKDAISSHDIVANTEDSRLDNLVSPWVNIRLFIISLLTYAP